MRRMLDRDDMSRLWLVVVVVPSTCGGHDGKLGLLSKSSRANC